MWRVVEAFHERLAEAPDRVVVVDDDGAHTAADLAASASAVRDVIRDAVGGAPTVAAQAPNDRCTVAIALAVGELGGTLAVLPPGLGPAEAELALDDVRPSVVLAGDEAAERWGVRGTAAGLEGWTAAVRSAPQGSRWEGGIVIGLTSGSTGRAKAIVQTEAALAYAADHALAAAGVEPGEPVAAVSPLASTPGFGFGPYLALRHGSPLALCRRWDSERVLRRLRDSGARWLIGVPTHMLKLADAARATGLDLGHMRAIAVGGGPMGREALEDAEGVLGVRFLRLFGMSECLGHTTVALDDPPEVRLETEGRPFPGTEDLVVDASGAPVPGGTVGDIVVRGPSLMLGYAREGRLAAPELTASGHYITGDLGCIGPDGRLRVTGRRKNIIMRAGKGVDAVEVETALMEHPAVVEACVVAVPHATLGEQAAALVVALPDARVTKSELAAFLEARGMSKYKWPELVFGVDALPRTATGKLARATAAELACDLVAQHV